MNNKRPSSVSKDDKERKLGSALICYTNKNNRCYDPVFDAEIRKLRPDWFENTVRTNKDGLLELARNGSKRPSCCSKDKKECKLGDALVRYTNKRRSAYDPVFNTEIRKLRPDWFENTVRTNKDRLLELTRNGDKRPSKSSKDDNERKLGTALSSYTCKSKCAYDPIFDAEIRKLRPDWFENTARTNKDKLFELARDDGKRPSCKSQDDNERKLGIVLGSYICKSHRCYDPIFDAEIRKLRPDWFENTARTNKDKLFELARDDGKRPSKSSKDDKERKLGDALSRYTSKRSDTYDPVFDAEIRKLRPDWFKS